MVVVWRIRYKLSLRDLVEMFAVRGYTFSHETARRTPAGYETMHMIRKGQVKGVEKGDVLAQAWLPALAPDEGQSKPNHYQKERHQGSF